MSLDRPLVCTRLTRCPTLNLCDVICRAFARSVSRPSSWTWRLRIKPPQGVASREAKRFDQLDRLLAAQCRCPSVAGSTSAISPNDVVEGGTATFIRLCHDTTYGAARTAYKSRRKLRSLRTWRPTADASDHSTAGALIEGLAPIVPTTCQSACPASSYCAISSAVRPVLLRSDREHWIQFPRSTGARSARVFKRE